MNVFVQVKLVGFNVKFKNLCSWQMCQDIGCRLFDVIVFDLTL